MKSKRNLVNVFGLGFTLLLLGAAPNEAKSPFDFGGADRYLTLLSTDKPIYRAGEKVYLRGVLLKADDHTPLAMQSTAQVQVKGPRGDIVSTSSASVQDGALGFSWEVPPGQAGGEYTLNVSYPSNGYTPAERKFDIRAYRPPQLKSQIVFGRDGLGPGDSVSATLHVDRPEGGSPTGAKVTAYARLDGEEIWKKEFVVDAGGNCSVQFALPKTISRGEGTLSLVIQDGGVVETASKTIPILLQTVDLTVYPEGGNPIADVNNRFYLQAYTPAGKPADLAGQILDGAGKAVAEFKTSHEGRGRFEFTPVADQKYVLKINQPAGITRTFDIPQARIRGVAISTAKDAFGAKEDVELSLNSPQDFKGKLVVVQRDKILFTEDVSLKAKQPLKIKTTVGNADGVMVATVYDDSDAPLAERLVFRMPREKMNVQITADQKEYVPGDKVVLNIKTADANGKPVSGVVGLTVTDDRVLEMIEKREQAPRLGAMFYLENDMKDLADAKVYLDDKNPGAAMDLDLLLGTQGWRRYALVQPQKFMDNNGDDAKRVLAFRDKPVPQAMPMVVGMGMGGGGGGMGGGGMGGGMGGPVARGGAALRGPVQNEGAIDRNAVRVLEDRANDVANKPMGKQLAGELAQAMREAPAIEDGARGGGRAGGGRMAAQRRVAAPVYVREYAHERPSGWTEGVRSDFAETVYWSSGVKTDSNGIATVSFNLSDSVTGFRALADGFTSTGGIGESEMILSCVQPFAIEPKIPLNLISGDTVRIPVAINNGTSRNLTGASIKTTVAKGLTLLPSKEDSLDIPSRKGARQMVDLKVDDAFSGNAELTFQGNARPFQDVVNKRVTVKPYGFPIDAAAGGQLAENTSAKHSFTIPQNAIGGSLSCSAAVYPTPLGSLTKGLEAMIRQPNGCFEQTSSSNYPLVMAQQYFLSHTGVDPKLIEKAKEQLKAGYTRLTSFESPGKGYEWFGANPGHEALTAYGLMEFVEMKGVMDVDVKMIERTQKWLLDRRDGKGGFNLDTKAIDTFGRAPVNTTNAYILWTLVESGQKDIDKEIAALKQATTDEKDSYVIALAANVFAQTGDEAYARTLMNKIAQKQDTTGLVKGGVTSITCSSGNALEIETTSLAMLAWMRQPTFTPNVEKSMQWLFNQSKDGRYASTQSTILALKAIIDYDKSRARPKNAGQLALLIDGKVVGDPIDFDTKTEGALVFPDFAKSLPAGKHDVELKMINGGAMPYSLAINFYSPQPDSSDKCKLNFTTTLNNAQVVEGALTEINVAIENKSQDKAPTPIAIVGIPAGLEVRHDQLKELVKSGKIDAYEVRDNEVICYWRVLKAAERREFPISLTAAIPGTYKAPASRAYLYYEDENKQWTPGLSATVNAR